MKPQQIHIKNMVCPRCIAIVRQVFKSLDIDILSVSLGEVVCTQPITNDQRDEIKNILGTKN